MLGIGNRGVRAKFRRLKSGIEEFDPSSDAWKREWRSSSLVPTLGIRKGGVRAKFRPLESGMEEFEPKFRSLESEMEEFEPSWNREWRSSSVVPTLAIGYGGVRAKLGRLKSEMEEFEPSSDAWNRKW